MPKKLQLDIVTLERTVYSGEVDHVSIPTKMGEITILPNHIPLVSALASGELKAAIGNDLVSMAVYGGFVEVLPQRVVVLADTAELAQELEAEKITKAKERVEELIKKYPKESEEYTILSERLAAELAKVKMAEQFKNKRKRKV